MPITNTAYFGAPDDLTSNTVSYSSETIAIMDGLKETQHVKTVQMTLKRDAQLCDSFGIADSGDTTRNTPGLVFDTVSLERQEVVSNPCFDTHPDFLNSGAFTAPDGTKVIQFLKAHLWLGITERITLTGKFKGGWDAADPFVRECLKVGRRITQDFRISPAIHPSGTVTPYDATVPMTVNTYPHIAYAAHADPEKQFIVQESEFVQQEDWHTFNVVLYRKLGIASGSTGASSTLLNSLRLFNPNDKDTWKPSDAWQGFDAIADGNIEYYSITSSLTLSANEYATLSETIVVFPSVDDDEILDLATPTLV